VLLQVISPAFIGANLLSGLRQLLPHLPKEHSLSTNKDRNYIWDYKKKSAFLQPSGGKGEQKRAKSGRNCPFQRVNWQFNLLFSPSEGLLCKKITRTG
jgi:hypothetical protein